MVLLTLSACLIYAPPRNHQPEDTAADCPYELVSTHPEPGERSAYHRTSVEVRFDTSIHTNPTLALSDPEGVPVPGDSHWRGSTRVLTPHLPLEPETTYGLEVDWACEPWGMSFTTSAAGLPVEEAAWDAVWAVELQEARVLEPLAPGDIVLAFLRDHQVLLDLTGPTLWAEVVGEDWPPASTCADSEMPVLATEGPWFEVGPGQLQVPMEDLGTMTLAVHTLAGTIHPDGHVEGLSLVGHLDTRALSYDGNALCPDLMESLGVECEACADGAPHCLPMHWTDLQAAVVPDLERVVLPADADGDGWTDCGGDCDDTRAEAWPGAEELCNGLDDDCDGERDEGSGNNRCHLDADGDRHGDPEEWIVVCRCPPGWVPDGTDCDDTRADVFPGQSESCNLVDDDCDGVADEDHLGSAEACPATTCADLLDVRPDLLDGTYLIDAGTGVPFGAWCDMSTDGGGWTQVPYADDLALGEHHSGGDAWRWLEDDLELAWDEATVLALAALSTEGRQTWIAQCEDVVHFYDAGTATFDAAAGFRFADGTETSSGASAWTPHDITASLDECASGGTGRTVFVFDSPLVPVVNLELYDGGDAGERFGAALLDEPAWLR